MAIGEQLRPSGEQPREIIGSAWSKMTDYILRQYGRNRGPVEKAREDALCYVSIQFAWLNVSHYLESYEPFNKHYKRTAESIEEAQKGNWQPMKSYIQSGVHVVMEASTDSEDVKGQLPPDTTLPPQEELEDLGTALANLASSLDGPF